MYWLVWMYTGCLEAERSPTQCLLHVSAVSEPSLRAMSTFTAGFLQAELPALGRVVRFLLTYSSSLGPGHRRHKGRMALNIRKATVRTFVSLLYKPFHKAGQEKVKAEQALVIPCYPHSH